MMVVVVKHFHADQYYYQPRGRYRRLAEFQNKTMKISYGVYMAALAGIFAIIGGAMMLCQGCGSSDDDDEYYDTSYQQGQERPIVRENAYC